MSDFSKIGLSIALSDSGIRSWIDRMAELASGKSSIRDFKGLHEFWEEGVRAYRMSSGCSTGSLLPPLFAPDSHPDPEEKRMREAVDLQNLQIRDGLSVLRALIRSMAASADPQLSATLSHIGSLLDQTIPSEIRDEVISRSENIMGQVALRDAGSPDPRKRSRSL